MSEQSELQAGTQVLQKGDFTTGIRLVWISALALLIGAVCAFLAWLLLGLIDFFTSLFYFHEISFDPLHLASPAQNTLGLWAILIPVGGGLIIGLMARYGSDRIRGHGIPEALEAILIGRSRMSPKVAVLKPLSSAVSIGSGGPFGAEGPIIMTGGAFGSIIAQVFNLTAAERKTLLVAGAAGGMTATFGTPVASVLLAIELLLFELKPRSVVPVALACIVAAALRPLLLEHGTYIRDYATHADFLPWTTLAFAALIGLCGGLFSLLLTLSVYAMEDLFHHLKRIHWMWWPALGGLAVGVGGYFVPRTLGIGVDVINGLLDGEFTGKLLVLLPLLLVKCLIWSTALGSGTSGGVLAPLLMIGGGVGAVVGSAMPGEYGNLWPLIGMAAIMGGTMRSPLTGTLFALELTHDIKAMPALLIASVVAYGFTVLVMKRSILTEKVARRGYHISREYAVDPLELVTVGEVMTVKVVAIPAQTPAKKVLRDYFLAYGEKGHQAYPVVDAQGKLLGVITRRNLLEDWVSVGLTNAADDGPGKDLIIAYDLIHREPVAIFPWESCRTAAERMAASGVGRLPVVSPDSPTTLVGIVTRSDLLKPRARSLEEEGQRERFFGPGRRSLPKETGLGQG
jgi:H+/Cl- antiporter ClcA/predicted transcriptional regulator